MAHSLHFQPGVFYDYSGSARPPVYYPTQPMVYHAPPSHSPMLTPQLAASVPATLSDKKRELQVGRSFFCPFVWGLTHMFHCQYNLQQHQQMTSQGLMYPSLRSSPSPHQAYAGALDYGSQLPLMLPGGAIYAGLSPQSMHMYQQGIHSGRRREGDNPALRSPILDEFRANKSRKWELRVSAVIYPHLLALTLRPRTSLATSWSLAVISTGPASSSKSSRPRPAKRNKLCSTRSYPTIHCN